MCNYRSEKRLELVYGREEYLTEREEETFKEGTRFVERFLDCHVKMVIQFLVLCNIIPDFI